MRLVLATPDRVELRARRAAQPPLFVGLAFLAMGCAALVADGDLTVTRALATGACLLVGGWLTATSWPRLQRIVLAPKEKRLTHPDGSLTLAPDAVLHLTAVEEEDEPCEYRVELRTPDAPPIVVLSREAPDEVLRELDLLHRCTGLRIRGGWGLPDDTASWGPGARARPAASMAVDARGEPLDVRLSPYAGVRNIAWTVGIGGLMVAVIMSGQVMKRLQQGDPLTLFSASLPVAAVLLVGLVGIGIGTHHVRLVLNGSLHREVRVAGFRLARTVLPRSTIRHAYFVGLDATHPRHVVLDTDEGPLAIPCDGTTAPDLQASLERALSRELVSGG